MPSKKSKRRSHSPPDQPPKQVRLELPAAHSAAANDGVIAVSTISDASLSPSPVLPSDSSSSSAAALLTSLGSSVRSSAWHTLPLELLVLIADFVPHYRVLLPLSSTNRHFYELIHEERASGPVQTETAIQDLPVRLSCWRRHPAVTVAICRTCVKVDKARAMFLEKRDASFVSYVLTSLRNVPHLELVYECAGGPHAANLYPLHHFTHLRSLSLILGQEDSARQQNLATVLSAALVSLPSLISLTAYISTYNNNPLMLLPGTLQQLADERLLHITINGPQYAQLSMPDRPLGRRKHIGKRSPFVYPRVRSVTASGDDSQLPAVSDIVRLFPNVQHIALGYKNVIIEHAGISTVPPFDSLHMHVRQIPPFHRLLNNVVRYQLRCLSLRWDFVEPLLRVRVSNMLALTPCLTQLAITGTSAIVQRSIDTLEEIPSIFTVSSDSTIEVDTSKALLPELTYLQFTSGLLTQDIEHLLSPAAPPAFAASLTHLALRIRWADRHVAAARLPLLPHIYPSLQKCNIALQKNYGGETDDVWAAAVDALGLQLGSVWCDSEKEVRMARSDVEWRRNAGLPPVPDDQIGEIQNVNQLSLFESGFPPSQYR